MAGEGQGAILSLGIELAGRQQFISDIRAVSSEYVNAASRMNRVQLSTSIGGGYGGNRGIGFSPGIGYIGGGGEQGLLYGPGMGYAPSYRGGGVQPYRPPNNFTYGRSAPLLLGYDGFPYGFGSATKFGMKNIKEGVPLEKS